MLALNISKRFEMKINVTLGKETNIAALAKDENITWPDLIQIFRHEFLGDIGTLDVSDEDV